MWVERVGSLCNGAQCRFGGICQTSRNGQQTCVCNFDCDNSWSSCILYTYLYRHKSSDHRIPRPYFAPNFPNMESQISRVYRAMICQRGICRRCVCPSVCPSVCLSIRPSVTSRCSTKTAKRRIMQSTPHDSAGTLIFRCQASRRNSNGVIPNVSAKWRWVG